MQPALVFADVFVPDFGALGDVGFEEFEAFAAAEIDDFDAVYAEPIEAAGKLSQR